MAQYCTFRPKKGGQTFSQLKKELGYQLAKDVFMRSVNTDFLNDYRNTLTLDSEGVPTYDSIMRNPYMKKFIGKQRIIGGLEKRYQALDDTLDNYHHQLEAALQFNTKDASRDDFVAVVRSEGGKVRVRIEPKTEASMNEFKNQYGSYKLNDRLANMFSELGVTVGRLNAEEQSAGRTGVTDFSKAMGIASGFASLIRIANNMEGSQALTEEFAHTIIGIMRKEPLIRRAIEVLQGNREALKSILGDDYDDVVSFSNEDMALVAEEALGHILRDNLCKYNPELNNVPNKSLFRRLIDFIKRKFRNFNASDVEKIINNVDSYMSTVAQDVLNGSVTFTKEDVTRSQRDAQFNALSDRINHNIEILKEAAKTEAKRAKMNLADESFTKSVIADLLKQANPEGDTVLGLMQYSATALSHLRGMMQQFEAFSTMPKEQKFGFLRMVHTTLSSYGSFIDSMYNAINKEEEELAAERAEGQEEDGIFNGKYNINGEELEVNEVIKELNDIVKRLGRKYADTALPMFTEFLKPFFGESITVPFGKDKGKVITVEEIVKQADKDITFTDRWLDSMADSSDLLLATIDKVVANAKGRARLKTIDDIRDIQALRQKTEEYGITDFEWFFEKDDEGHKTGNYLTEINYGQFEKDRKQLERELTEKYGKNPTGEEAKKKIAERNAWYATHAVSLFGDVAPNAEMYHNSAFDNMTAHQKEVYEGFMELKGKLEVPIPKNRRLGNRAIQQRKSSVQRILDLSSNPSALFESMKEAAAAQLLEREDDDRMFGDQVSRRGMTDFEGREYNILPVLYTTKLRNPEELSTDIFASLMSYAFMANNYGELDKIIDPLEVGRDVIREQRKVLANRGGRKVAEKFKSAGIDVTNLTKVSKSYIEQKLDDFYDCQLYGKYLKDEGTWDIFGKQVNKQKLVSWILQNSSLAQLGFNFLANLANLGTGIGMQNIEAASHQFFTPSQLASADKDYMASLMSFIPELGARVKTNKLSLFDDLFDIKQTFNQRVSNSQKKSLLERVAGENVAFLGQDCGDHWLYNRTAIAMAKNQKVKVGDKEMNLWDALQVKTDENGLAYLNYKDIKNIDGTDFDVITFSRKIADVNHRLFGIYNQDDMNAASRVAVGRLLQQYRKWMKVQMNTRFQGVRFNTATNTWEEGYYHTMGRLANELVRGKVQLASLWDSLSDTERANVKRGLCEILQFAAVWALANLIEWPDDKDRPRVMKLLEYITKREAHELGGLTPSLVFLKENLKTIKTPIPSISVAQSSIELLSSIMDPRDWVDEKQSGPYKGMSTLEKNIIKAPIWGVAQWRQIDKFTGDLDTSIQFYMRPSY